MAINNNGYWSHMVKVGDVIAERNGKGTPRVVRRVTYGKSGLPTHVDLSIQRCSWTTRPITTLNYVDLGVRRFVPTGAKVKLTSEMDRALAKECETKGLPVIHCCDVVGVIS